MMINKVSNYRKFKGLTQQEMADYLSISVQAYRKKEKNFTPFKDAEKLLIRDKVKKYGFLDITIDDIFFTSK